MLKNFLIYFFFFFLFLIPKKKNLYVFGDRDGRRFCDNSRYLFFYLSKNNKNRKFIWITKDKDIIKKINNIGYKSYYYNSFWGVYYCLFANWHIYNYSENDIHPILSKFSNNINLWHGALLKKIPKFQTNFFFNLICHFNTSLYNLFYKRYFFYPNYKYLDTLIKHFPKKYYIFLRSNFPRNIVLKKQHKNIDFYSTAIEKLFITQIKKKNVLGYFPTWRRDGIELFKNENNYRQLFNLNNTLERNNAILLYKRHMNSDPKDMNRHYNSKIEKIENKLRKFKNFIALDYRIDLNSVVSSCDLLVSDYSGVIFDYLFLNRPIVLYTPDHIEFDKIQGTLFNYDDIEIGHQVFNLRQLVKCLSIYFKNKKKFSMSFQKKKNIFFNNFFEVKSCFKNILNVIKC